MIITFQVVKFYWLLLLIIIVFGPHASWNETNLLKGAIKEFWSSKWTFFVDIELENLKQMPRSANKVALKFQTLMIISSNAYAAQRCVLPVYIPVHFSGFITA